MRATTTRRVPSGLEICYGADDRANGPNGGSSWLLDRRVLDSTGHPLGISVAVYARADTRVAEWVAVYTGRLDAAIVAVPVLGSSLSGDDLVVDHDRDTTLAAPALRAAVELDADHVALLRDHYRDRASRRSAG